MMLGQYRLPRVIGASPAGSRRHRPIVSHRRVTSPSTRLNRRIVRVAQPRRIFSNRVQHRLNVRRRAGDDAQDSLVAVCCSNDFLEFLEQPDVLNGDHRLVGEGFEELDLRRGEGTHLDATCVQRSNEFPLLTKRNG